MISGITWTHIQSFWNHSGPLEVPYSANSNWSGIFFPVSYSKLALAWFRTHNLSPWFSKFHRKIRPQPIFCKFISNLQQQSSKSAIILYCVYMILFAAGFFNENGKIQKMTEDKIKEEWKEKWTKLGTNEKKKSLQNYDK